MATTQLTVNAACDTIKKSGEKVTYRAVRKELGNTGSFATINKYLKQWEKAQSDAVQADYQPSDELRQALLVDVGDAIHQVKAKMQGVIDQQAVRFKELETLIIERETEVETLQARLKAAEDAVNKACGAAEEVRGEKQVVIAESKGWQKKYHDESKALAVMTNQFETLQKQYDELTADLKQAQAKTEVKETKK